VLEAPLFIQALVEPDTTLEVGAFCSVSGGRLGNVRIGRYCSIAPDVVIGANEHPVNWLTSNRVGHYPRSMAGTVSPARTGGFHLRTSQAVRRQCADHRDRNDVWLGYGSFIRFGVRSATVP